MLKVPLYRRLRSQVKLIFDIIAKYRVLLLFSNDTYLMTDNILIFNTLFLRLVAASLRKNRSLIYLDLERYSLMNINYHVTHETTS